MRTLTTLLAALFFPLPGAAWAADEPCASRGTLMTLALPFPLGVLAARNIVASPLVHYGAKLCLVAVFAAVLFAEVAVTANRKRGL